MLRGKTTANLYAELEGLEQILGSSTLKSIKIALPKYLQV